MPVVGFMNISGESSSASFNLVIEALDRKDAKFDQDQRQAIIAKLNEKTIITNVSGNVVPAGQVEGGVVLARQGGDIALAGQVDGLAPSNDNRQEDMVRRVEKRRNSVIGTESLEEQDARLKIWTSP